MVRIFMAKTISTFSNISLLSEEQLKVLDPIISLLLKDVEVASSGAKRIGVASGAYSVPENFDDPDVYGIPGMFGLE